jgi:hypothetical protein
MPATFESYKFGLLHDAMPKGTTQGMRQKSTEMDKGLSLKFPWQTMW